MILAIDPGTEQSAFVLFDESCGVIFDAFVLENTAVILTPPEEWGRNIAIEWIESYGMPVGREVFETVYWIGRFDQAFGPLTRITRRQVKLHLCNSPRATDANVRQALIDRFGGTREKAIGTKKTPGPLYGIKTHLWSALAVAITFTETRDKDFQRIPLNSR